MTLKFINPTWIPSLNSRFKFPVNSSTFSHGCLISISDIPGPKSKSWFPPLPTYSSHSFPHFGKWHVQLLWSYLGCLSSLPWFRSINKSCCLSFKIYPESNHCLLLLLLPSQSKPLVICYWITEIASELVSPLQPLSLCSLFSMWQPEWFFSFYNPSHNVSFLCPKPSTGSHVIHSKSWNLAMGYRNLWATHLISHCSPSWSLHFSTTSILAVPQIQRHTPVSGLQHSLFLSAWDALSQFVRLTASLPLGLCSNVTWKKKPSLVTLCTRTTLSQA